ncbi:MAG: hypothetical protein QOI56_522 [Actinomycetota bacterium]|nr:hypothetical protein [Actinomycetota bacterium]
MRPRRRGPVLAGLGRGAVLAGVGLAGLYLAAAAATSVLGDRPFRPLFDGLAPPPPYRWVNPPQEAARDNQQPAAASGEVPLGPDGSAFANITPEDAQVVVLLQDKAVPPHQPDTALVVTVTPVDALTLGPLPPKMSPQSNAYRVEVTYRPSGAAVAEFRGTTSSIALVGAAATDALLFSGDGKSWAARPTTPLGASHGLETPFAGTGYYVVTKIDDSGGGGTSPVLVGLVLVVPALVVGGLVVRRRGRAAGAAAKAQAAAARRRRALPPGGRKSTRRRR